MKATTANAFRAERDKGCASGTRRSLPGQPDPDRITLMDWAEPTRAAVPLGAQCARGPAHRQCDKDDGCQRGVRRARIRFGHGHCRWSSAGRPFNHDRLRVARLLARRRATAQRLARRPRGGQHSCQAAAIGRAFHLADVRTRLKEGTVLEWQGDGNPPDIAVPAAASLALTPAFGVAWRVAEQGGDSMILRLGRRPVHSGTQTVAPVLSPWRF